MRPIWMKCENCLYWDIDNLPEIVISTYGGICRFNIKNQEINDYKHGSIFCSEWTCQNCFLGLNCWEYHNEDHYPIFKDHSKCKPAKFE